MSSDLVIQILKKVPFFKGLDTGTLELFASCATLLKARKGEIIFREGQKSDSMFIIVKGEVEVSRIGKGGKKVVLANLTQPEVLGEMTLLDGKPRSATAATLEDTILFRLSRQDFQLFLRSNFDVALRIIEILSLRLRATDEKF